MWPTTPAERGAIVGVRARGPLRRTQRTGAVGKRHEGREPSRHAVADAENALQSLDGTERPARVAVRDDARRQHAPYIWKTLDFRGGRHVEIDDRQRRITGRPGTGLTRVRRGPARRPRSLPTGALLSYASPSPASPRVSGALRGAGAFNARNLEVERSLFRGRGLGAGSRRSADPGHYPQAGKDGDENEGAPFRGTRHALRYVQLTREPPSSGCRACLHDARRAAIAEPSTPHRRQFSATWPRSCRWYPGACGDRGSHSR